MKWDDHRSWVLGALAAVPIAFGAAVFSVVYASYYNRTHHIAEWGTLSSTLRIPVPLWVAFLLLIGVGVFALLYIRSRKAQIQERNNAERLEAEASNVEDHMKAIRQDHAAAIATLHQASAKQSFVDSPVIHIAWDGKTRWRWSYVKSQRVVHIAGMATIELDNTLRCPLITGVQIEGAQFVGEFTHFQLVPGQRAYQTLNLNFVGIAAEAGELLRVRFVFTDLKDERFPTKEMTFEPVEGAPTTVGEPAVQKKRNPVPPR